MPTSMSDLDCDSVAIDLATETLWRFFAAALRDPRKPGSEILYDASSQQLVCEAAELLRSEYQQIPIPLGFGELEPDALDASHCVDWLRTTPSALPDEFLRVFGLVICTDCPPYETDYQPNEDTFFRAQQMADVAGFYRAFGLTPDSRERPDHVAIELEFIAYLLMMSRLAPDVPPTQADEPSDRLICQEARSHFVRDHVAWWLTSFALAVEAKDPSGFYACVARLLRGLLPIERSRLGVSAPEIPLKAKLTIIRDECDSCAGDCGT